MASVGTMPSLDQEELKRRMKDDYGASEAEVAEALNALAYRNYVMVKERRYDAMAIRVPVEANLVSEPCQCSVCDEFTYAPYKLRSGRLLCKPCLEEALYKGAVRPEDVSDPYIDRARLDYTKPEERRYKKTFIVLTHAALQTFFDRIPRGRRGGSVEHTSVIGHLCDLLLKSGFYVEVDIGVEVPKRVEGGKIEYEGKQMPDILVHPILRHPKLNWGSKHVFSIEVEIDPLRSKQRVINNLLKNRRLGKPVIFVAARPDHVADLISILLECREEIVEDCTGAFGGAWDPSKVSVWFLDPATGTRFTVTRDMIAPENLPKLKEWLASLARQAAQAAPEGQAEQAAEGEAAKSVRASEEAPKEPSEEAAQAPKGGAVVNLEVADKRQITSIFSGPNWHFVEEFLNGRWTLIAEGNFGGKLVRAIIGPAEEYRRELELLGITPSVRQPEAKPKPPVEAAPQPPSASVPPTAKQTTPQPQMRQPPAPHPSTPPSPPVANAQEVSKAEIPAEKLKKYATLGYRFSLQKRGAKFALYAQKWVKGKVDKQYIGMWCEELKRLTENLNIKVRGLDKTKT